MNDDQFTKLFEYMTERFDSLEEKVDQKADETDIERLINTIVDFIRRITDSETEQFARDAQFARLGGLGAQSF